MAEIEILIQNEYFLFVLILLGSIATAEIFYFILRNYVKKITEKTKSHMDDEILKVVSKPLHVSIISIGLYLALKSLSALAQYVIWMDRAFFIFLTFTIALIISRILKIFVGHWLKVQRGFEKTPQLINKIVSMVIYLVAILIILDNFNIQVTPLIATLGLGGVAVGLALQSTLSDFFAGIHLISDRPINVGDFIELEGNISGYVEDIGWKSTKIRTLPNTIVIVPNSKLSQTVITNYSLPEPSMATLVQCGVAYGSDLEKVEKVTMDVARKIQKSVPGAVKDFEPFIRYHTFADSNINFTVILRVEKFVDKYLVTHEFIKALKERYDKEDIEISWPVRKIYYDRTIKKE